MELKPTIQLDEQYTKLFNKHKLKRSTSSGNCKFMIECALLIFDDKRLKKELFNKHWGALGLPKG